MVPLDLISGNDASQFDPLDYGDFCPHYYTILWIILPDFRQLGNAEQTLAILSRVYFCSA